MNSNGARGKMNSRIKVIGQIVMALAIVFIVWRMWSLHVDFSGLSEPGVIPALLGVTAVYALSVLLSAYFYEYQLSVVSKNTISKANVVRLYCKTYLYRYIPGNVMHLIGRNSIAVEENVSFADINIASLLQQLALTLSAICLSLILAGDYCIKYLMSISLDGRTILIIVVVLLIIVALLVVFRKKAGSVIRTCREKLSGISAGKIAVMFAFACGILLLNAVVYILCLYALSGTMPGAQMIPAIIGLYVLSWLVGFITPGAPAGIGIRETMMIVIMGGLVSLDMLAFSAVVLRVVCVIGEVAVFLIAQIHWVRHA